MWSSWLRINKGRYRYSILNNSSQKWREISQCSRINKVLHSDQPFTEVMILYWSVCPWNALKGGHPSWCNRSAPQRNIVTLRALQLQDQLPYTLICRAILKLTRFVCRWFQLSGLFGSCRWGGLPNSITRWINQRVHLWAKSIMESVR